MVIGGPVSERVDHATDAVRDGATAVVLWPPAPSALEAERLAAHADEAGVEIGVARPLAASTALSSVSWSARLVTLSLVGRTDGRLAQAGWRTALAGALDVCAALTEGRGTSRLDVAAERDGDALRAVVLAARFGNGAYAQASIRFSDARDDEVTLYASRPGARLEAQSLAVPFGLEGAAALADDLEAAEVDAFLEAAAEGQPAPFALDRALATMRLAERVRQHLR